MAIAKQCDRCGKFYLFNIDTPRNVICKTYSGMNRKIYLEDDNNGIDLCESCLTELKGWWIKIAYLSEANKNSKEDN